MFASTHKVPEGLPFGGTQTRLRPWLSWGAGGMEGPALTTVGVEALGPELPSPQPLLHYSPMGPFESPFYNLHNGMMTEPTSQVEANLSEMMWIKPTAQHRESILQILVFLLHCVNEGPS